MINPLTSFRFIAAVSVFLIHAGYFKEGYIGVTFFFILSGFILTYNYYDKFVDLSYNRLKNFYKSRISRIYPVHLLTLFVSIPFVGFYVFLKHSDTVGAAIQKGVLNIFLLQSYVPSSAYYFSYNTVSWSLSAEMFFYTLLPFILTLLHKVKLETKSLLLLATLLYVLFLITVFKLQNYSFSEWLFYIFPVFRLFDFVVGISLALIFIKNKKILEEKSKERFSFLELLSLLCLAIAIGFKNYVPQAFRWDVYYLPFMSMIIFIFSNQKGVISKLLSNKKIIYLGEISFSFYMIHLLVLRYITNVSKNILVIILCFCVSLLLSHLTYKYYEQPMRRKLANFSFTKTKNKALFNSRSNAKMDL